MHNKIDVQLQCGDWIKLPVESHTAYAGYVCPNPAHKWQRIVKRNLFEWRVRCQKCNFSRWTGFGGEPEARRLAARHKSREPEHFVTVALDKVTPDGKGNLSLPRRDSRGLNMRPTRRVSWSSPIPPQKIPPEAMDNPPPF